MHYALLEFSTHLALMVTRKGYELYSSTDKRFVTDVILLLQNEFSYRPSLSASQFLSSGYAERKIIFICDVVKLCRRKHQELRKLSQLVEVMKRMKT